MNNRQISDKALLILIKELGLGNVKDLVELGKKVSDN